MRPTFSPLNLLGNPLIAAKDTSPVNESSFTDPDKAVEMIAVIGFPRSGGFGGAMMADLVTDEDLARARKDPDFRQKFMADHLDRLLEALNVARRSASNPARAKQIREGVDLAVKLAEILNTQGSRPGTTRAA
jgi:hypothetical protein